MNRHLSDDELQGYLDRDASVDRRRVEKLLADSPADRQALESFRRIFKGLEDDTGFMLSANFADNVLNHVYSAKEKRFDMLENGLIGLGLLSGFIYLLYYLGVFGMGEQIAGQFGQWQLAAQNVIPRGLDALAVGGTNLVILVAALMAYILFEVADKMVLPPKR